MRFIFVRYSPARSRVTSGRILHKEVLRSPRVVLVSGAYCVQVWAPLPVGHALRLVRVVRVGK
jgi:hypothetical protein